MIPAELKKKLISLWGNQGIHQSIEKMNTLKEVVDNFDSYDKFDVEWIMDGIWGEKVDLDTEIAYLIDIYNTMVEKRNEKWGEDYEP